MYACVEEMTPTLPNGPGLVYACMYVHMGGGTFSHALVVSAFKHQALNSRIKL
jgi:hypothetical protein